MSHQHLPFRAEARTEVLKAAQIADAVRVTLEPQSKWVLIERKWGAPLVGNAGVTIAEQIQLGAPASVASVLLPTEATLTELSEPEERPAVPAALD